MTPSVREGVNGERRRHFGAGRRRRKQTADRAAVETDGNVVEKRGGQRCANRSSVSSSEAASTSQVCLPPSATSCPQNRMVKRGSPSGSGKRDESRSHTSDGDDDLAAGAAVSEVADRL